MKELKKYSTEELKKELQERTWDEHWDKENTLPKKYPEYEITGELEESLFYVHVDEGSEGFNYCVTAKVNEYSEDEVRNAIRHHVIKSSEECGNPVEKYNWGIDHITVKEIGRYGGTYMKLKNIKE